MTRIKGDCISVFLHFYDNETSLNPGQRRNVAMVNGTVVIQSKIIHNYIYFILIVRAMEADSLSVLNMHFFSSGMQISVHPG